MSWLRLDDGFTTHPKFEGWAAAEKWSLVELFAYCARYRTEGRVPSDLALLPRAVTSKLIGKAEASGFLEQRDGGLWVHDWEDYNPSDPTAADRARRYRSKRDGEAVDERETSRQEA